MMVFRNEAIMIVMTVIVTIIMIIKILPIPSCREHFLFHWLCYSLSHCRTGYFFPCRDVESPDYASKGWPPADGGRVKM